MIIAGAHSYSSSYDEVKEREDLEFVAHFLQEVQDGVDMSTPFDSISERINSEIYLTDLIKELEEKGFWIFAGLEKQKLSGGVKCVEDDWYMAILYIVSKNSPTIRMADAAT